MYRNQLTDSIGSPRLLAFNKIANHIYWWNRVRSLSTGSKVFSTALALCLLLGIVAVFGGSAISLIGGANALDIDGNAEITSRPPNTIDVGNDWNHYGGDAGGHRYSKAAEINASNVAQLVPAWEFHTGDMTRRADYMSQSATEGTPILVGDSLIFCTPFNEVIALSPEAGTLRWRFDPAIDINQDPSNQFICRGIAHWQDGGSTDACSSRIFMGTNDARLIALDAKDGRPCKDFGIDGEVQIDPGMPLRWAGEFQITSPPVTIGDTVVVGSSIGDGARVAAPVGVVRAFDARTGNLKWEWDPIPREPSDPAALSWKGDQPPQEGHANVWAPMTADEGRGLLFLPTSSPSPDFFGGLRPGENRHANSVVAIHGETGEVVWSFQTVHHDIWDYDLPAQPGLYSVWRDGALHDVVAQVTKTGFVFVLDRDTGKPFLPIEERPVPQNGAEGEWLHPTQPFPVNPPAIVPSTLSPDDAFGITLFDRMHCRRQIENSVTEGLFTPPSTQGTIFYPFTGGGANWGGAAYDPERNLLIVNMSNIANDIQLIPTEEFEEVRRRFPYEEVSPQEGAPFGMKRTVLLSFLGIPCTPPPWGVLAAIDLTNGNIVWRKTLGSSAGVRIGLPNFGGPIVTAGGLIFLAATMDEMMRAFDVETGELLWEWQLPAGGQATPMTYELNGRQYVLIYAGGHSRAGTRLGDTLIAFALNL